MLNPVIRASATQLSAAFGMARVTVRGSAVFVRSAVKPDLAVRVEGMTERGLQLTIVEDGDELFVGGPVSVSTVVRAVTNTLKASHA